VINRQHYNRGSANWSLPYYLHALKHKKVFPAVAVWMEQPAHRSRGRIDAGNVRPFVSIAETACQGQIVFSFRAAMLLGDNVINAEPQSGIRLRQAAVCAKPAGTTTHAFFED
jgi:hypothetical protein